jgi:type IV pilus assembly protein PilN
MRQLEESEWFSEPNLRSVKANEDFGEHANDFEMVVALTSPNIVDDEKGKPGKKPRPNKKR